MTPVPVPGPEEAGCTVLHVAVDDFHVSVQLLRRPDLLGSPVAVAGGRGVVLCATPQARRQGVCPGAPLSRARRLCPSLTVLTADEDEAARAWAGVLEVLRCLTPVVEPSTQGSAFLDVSGAGRRLGGPAGAGRLLRDLVADEQGLTCSVGGGSSKVVAALASAAAAPDGLLLVGPARTVEFLHALPAGALPGVGPRTGRVLELMGLRTVADLAHAPLATLVRALGEGAGRRLHALAWGRDDRPVLPAAASGPGAGRSFPRDVDDPRLVHRELLRLATRTAARARAAGVAGRTVVLRLRFADDGTLTRSRTLPERTDVTRLVHAAARDLFDGLGLQRARLRGVSLRLEGLGPAAGRPHQLQLGERARGWPEADGAVDRAGARFGSGSVRPATLLEPSGGDAPVRGTPPGHPGVGAGEDWSPPRALPGGSEWWTMC
ncbi:DNA polymerase Y family protein [Kineococcus sp. SYSU DK018]|uniref:DNA polymerase Y family protein n=1 Tax=Kineococcus sp. SYSU DK018 TaxID=3383139 RepID=UPI003D7C4E99